MTIDTSDQIDRFREFFEIQHKGDIHRIISLGKHGLIVDFASLAQFDPDLAEQLLDEPEDSLKSAELALEQFDIGTHNIKIRVINLPSS